MKWLFVESVIVGIYSMVIFLLLTNFFKNKSTLFFLTGVLKHLFGWLSGMQQWYCDAKKPRHSRSWSVGLESIAEGLLFVFCSFLFMQVHNLFIVAFLIGMGLHISFDFLGIHTFFCDTLYHKNY